MNKMLAGLPIVRSVGRVATLGQGVPATESITNGGASRAAGGGMGNRMRRQLQQEVASGFGLSVPDDMPEIVHEQARGIRVSAVALAACGCNGLAMVLLDFHRQIGPAVFAAAGLIGAIYAVWLVLALRAYRAPWFTRFSCAMMVAQGLLWGFVLYRLAQCSVDGQSNMVVGLAMGLVSTPILAAPFSLAISFWLPAAVGSELAVCWGLATVDPFMAHAFVGYEVFTLVGVIFINRTLLERSRARLALAAKNETVELLLNDYEQNASDWLWETDALNRMWGITPRFAQVLGSQARLAAGRPLAAVLGLERRAADAAATILDLMAESRPFRDLLAQVTVDGDERWWLLSGRPMASAEGAFLGYRGVGSDVTDKHRADETTHYMATHDTLTGLANRAAFNDRLCDACGDSRGGSAMPFALLMMDLDRFKEINDVYGHANGDLVLGIVAQRLRGSVRPADTLARLGGDEFALIMPGVGAREAAIRATSLIAVVSENMRMGDSVVAVGASVGITLHPGDAVGATNLLRNADLALYRAKEAGRGTFQVFDPAFGEQFQDKMKLLSELKLAVEENALEVSYQPIIDVLSGRVVAVEALCRWNNAQRGMVPPSVFIPLAEESGLISRLGQQVLTRACRSLGAGPADVSVSVNLSPLQLREPELADFLAATLAETCLAPERLAIEITESAWLKADVQTREQLARIEQLGIKIVLDDFGTGFSSLSSLHSFRFDGIKVDAEFTRDLERDPKASAILRLVAALAVELGMELTAEGIETASQMEFVRQFNIPRAQGYLIGRPGSWHPERAELAKLDEV